MYIGKRLRRLRELQGLSQKDLARGIVSSSHLSNIESGRFEPDSLSLELFAKKLEVPVDYLVDYNVEDKRLTNLLSSAKINIYTNLNRTIDLLNEVDSNYKYIPSIYQEAYHCLIKICTFLKKHQYEQALDLYNHCFIKMIDDVDESFPRDFKEIYYYVFGIIKYQKEDYSENYDSFSKHYTLLSDKNLMAKADANYNIALSLYGLNNFQNSIKYARNALLVYLSNSNWHKAADTQVLIGIIYWELQKLEHAEEYLLLALKLCNQYDYRSIQEKIYHNLGLVYYTKNDYTKSLYYFQESITLDSEGKSITYYFIIEIYLKLRRLTEVPILLQEAKSFCTNETDVVYIKSIEAKYLLNIGLNNRYEKMMEEVINYFKNKKEWKYCLGFSEEIGEYYIKNRKYKKSAYFFQLSLYSLKQLQRRKLFEES